MWRYMNQVYSKHSYNIYKVSDGYIVHNTVKDFQKGHTHLNSFKSAKYLIDLAVHRSIPYHLDRYRLISLSRITEDEKYKEKILELVGNKKNKLNYVNSIRKCG
jgi:hypothetical protein